MDAGTTPPIEGRDVKTSDVIERENRQLRTMLRRVLDLTECSDNCSLNMIRSEIEVLLKQQDLRSTNSGFNNPEMLAKVAAKRGAKRAAYLADVAPVLRELKDMGISYARMAMILNEREIKAPSGGTWAAGSVKYQIDNLPEA